MGVMDKLRSGSDSTAMQIVMALVFVSFVFWGLWPQGDTTSTVAEVNGVKIMDTEYRRAYRDAERQREYQYERALSNAEKEQLGNEVRERLIRGEVLLQEAKRLGVEVSQGEVLLWLHDELDPDHKRLFDENGNWDVEEYQRFLKQRRLTQSEFEHRIYEDLMRQKLQTLVYLGASISEPEVRAEYIEDNTQIDLTYVRVRPQAFYKDVEVTDDGKKAWLEANPDRVKEIYQRDFDRKYNHPEQVRARMIALQVGGDALGIADLLPVARRIHEELAAGADFGDMARRWSEHASATSGGDLGLRDVTSMATDVVDAVDGVEVGQITDVVTGDDGVRIYKVEERKPAWIESEDDVRDAIAAQTMKEEKGPELAAAFAESLLASWKETGTLDEKLLDEHNLISSTTGLVKLAEPARMGPPEAMYQDARAAKLGDVLPEVYESGGILYVGQLSNQVEADLSRYDEDHDLIRQRALLERREEFMKDWVDQLVAEAKIKDYGLARRQSGS